ncbi:hypothetical protein [Viscerimonas tarda]
MKDRIILLILFVAFSSLLHGQTSENDALLKNDKEIKTTALSAGVMMGGGSLIGADLEVLAGRRLGVQLGVGISSFGGGLNYHLKDGVNSSFVSFQYFHQGFGNNHYASWLGPVFVYRSKKLFQAGIGVGNLIDKGPQWTITNKSEKSQNATASLLFNLGLFF